MQLVAPHKLASTKLSPPRLSAGHVPRGRLLHRLHANADRSLTLLCAPAGSGKSTLLSEWLTHIPHASAWVSLDEDENDLELFLSYMLAAVRSELPDLIMATPELLEVFVLPPVEALAVSLSNDLAQIETDLLLVLDDYHLITNPHIHELLGYLLRHPPAGIHLAIATRAEPPWPLTALRARGRMMELRYQDLLFTAAESAAFLRQVLGDAADPALATALHEESEGWAAGLQLMTLVVGHQAQPATGAGRLAAVSEDIAAYLLNEVLASQHPAVQRRLLRMSILPRFSASLCEAVLSADSDPEAPAGWGQRFLAWLERANLFVSPHEGSPDAPHEATHAFFRFQHLFQQLLQRRLREHCAPEEVATLHRRAAAWFEAQGLLEEALEHALAAGDLAGAAELVARHRHDLYNHEQFARLTRWLRLLPPDLKAHHAELLLAEAFIAIVNWRCVEAANLLEQATQALERWSPKHPGRDVALGELAALRSLLALAAGDGERLQESARVALTLLPPAASHVRGIAQRGMAASAYLHGDAAQACHYLDTELARTSPQRPEFVWLLEARAFVLWLDGNLTELRVSATRLRAVSDELDLADQTATAHWLLGTVHYARHEFAAAERELTAAMAGRCRMRLQWWCQAAGVLALTHHAMGQPERARDTLAEAQAVLLERHAVGMLPHLGAFQAELDRHQDRLAEAAAWAEQVAPGPLTFAMAVVEPRLAQVRVLLALETPAATARAAALLAEVRAGCARIPNRRCLLEVEALATLLHARCGEQERALQTLQHLVRAAAPHGWLRLFVDGGEPMADLLRQLATRRVQPHAVAHILAAFPPPAPALPPRHPTRLGEPLSAREREILALLARRDTNKEIAARLFIAPGTVKRHTQNIYRKLRVNDRREAVARAQELAWLPQGDQ